jgi:hypothetical protein
MRTSFHLFISVTRIYKIQYCVTWYRIVHVTLFDQNSGVL